MFVTLKRILKIGFKTFWRNGILSSASILTVTITLVLSTFVYFAFLLSTSTLERVENKVDINVYFTPDADQGKVKEFVDEVESLDFIDKNKTKFLSKKDVLKDFESNPEDKQIMEDVLSILDNQNPMGAVLNIKTKNIKDYKKLVSYLESDKVQSRYLNIIDSTNYSENQIIIKKIEIWMKYLEIIGFSVLGALLFISMMLIYNTIRLIIYSYREEIQVMKLIGASNFYARGPFLIEGILYGLVSGIISLIIIYFTLYYTTDFFKEIFTLNLYQYFLTHLKEFVLIILTGGVVISFISTYLVVSKYLNVEH